MTMQTSHDPIENAFARGYYAGTEDGYKEGWNAALSELRVYAAGLKKNDEETAAKPGGVVSDRMAEMARSVNQGIAAADQEHR